MVTFGKAIRSDKIEVALPELSGGVVVWYCVKGAYFIGVAFGRVLVDKQKIELDLGVIDGIVADNLVEMVPLFHDLYVVREVRSHSFVEKCPKCFHQFALTHLLLLIIYNPNQQTLTSNSKQIPREQ